MLYRQLYTARHGPSNVYTHIYSLPHQLPLCMKFCTAVFYILYIICHLAVYMPAVSAAVWAATVVGLAYCPCCSEWPSACIYAHMYVHLKRNVCLAPFDQGTYFVCKDSFAAKYFGN